MPLFKATSMDAGLERPRSASAVHVDDEVDHGEVALTPAPRSNVPPWYRGLHQSIRTLSQSGLDLHQLEEDSDEDDDDEILVKMQTACRSRSLDTRALSDAAAWWRRELTVDQSADQPLVVMSKWRSNSESSGVDKDVSTGHSTRDSSPPATDADHHGDYGDDGEYNSKHSDSYELPKDAHDEVENGMENGEDGMTSNMKTSVGQSTSRRGSTSAAYMSAMVRRTSVSAGPTTSTTQRGSTATAALSGNQRHATLANSHQPAERRVRSQLGRTGSRPPEIPRWKSVNEMLVDVRASVERVQFDAAGLPAAKTTRTPCTFAIRHLTSSGNQVRANNDDDGRFQESGDKVDVRQEHPVADCHKTTANQNQQNMSDAVNHVDEAPVLAETPQYEWEVAEARSLRRQRPASAHHIGSTYVNAEPTSQRQVVYRSTSFAHPPPAQSSVSAASQAAASTEDLTTSFSRKDADAVSPGTMRAALERFRSLEALSTTSNTTSLRRESSRRTASWIILSTSQPVSDDASQGDSRAEPASEDTASKNKGNGVQLGSTNDIGRMGTVKDASKNSDDGLQQHRSTNDTGRLDTPEDTTNHRTRKLASLSRFMQALAKFRSMEEMAQTVRVDQGGILMKPDPAGGLLSSTPVNEGLSFVIENEAASPLNSSRQQITRHLATTSDHLRRGSLLSRASSLSSELEVSRVSTLPRYQSRDNIFTDLVRPPPTVAPGRWLHRWPPQDVGVPSAASRLAYSVSDIATMDNGDEDLRPTLRSSCCGMARPPSHTPATGAEVVAEVEDVPTTMKSSMYVQLRVTPVTGCSQCSLRVLTHCAAAVSDV